MGRFYFHIRQGDELLTDEEGSELSDAFAAQLEAEQAARELLVEAIIHQKDEIPDAVVIADAHGREIDAIPLTAVLPKPLRG